LLCFINDLFSWCFLQDFLQDNNGMNLAAPISSFLNSTTAARTVTIVLLAALAGLTTDAFLKLAFGTPAPSAEPVPATVGDIAKPVPMWLTGGDTAQGTAHSDVKLIGIVAQGEGGRQGYALIQTTGKRAQVLHVGQTLLDGTQLLRVQGKTATLNIGGQARVLSLEVPSGSAVAVNNAVLSPTPTVLQTYNPGADAAAQQAQMAQVAQIQQLQQAAVAQQANATAEPAAASEQALNGQFRRRMGGRP
jgi:hypothetical protein